MKNLLKIFSESFTKVLYPRQLCQNCINTNELNGSASIKVKTLKISVKWTVHFLVRLSVAIIS